MSFGWVDYFELACSLADHENEASHRSAISRAYYAAFHHARRYVRSVHPEVRLNKAGEDHFHVWDCLRKSMKRAERTAGITGKRLQDARIRADYEIMGLHFPQATRDALDAARTVLRELAASEHDS